MSNDEIIKAGSQALEVIKSVSDDYTSLGLGADKIFYGMSAGFDESWVGVDAEQYRNKIEELEVSIANSSYYIYDLFRIMEDHVNALIERAQQSAARAESLTTKLY